MCALLNIPTCLCHSRSYALDPHPRPNHGPNTQLLVLHKFCTWMVCYVSRGCDCGHMYVEIRYCWMASNFFLRFVANEKESTNSTIIQNSNLTTLMKSPGTTGQLWNVTYAPRSTLTLLGAPPIAHRTSCLKPFVEQYDWSCGTRGHAQLPQTSARRKRSCRQQRWIRQG